jgi:hypothetical protein
MYKSIAKILSRPRVFNYLLNRAKKTPYFHIYGEGDKQLYMERYWLFNPYPGAGSKLRSYKWFPLSIRIHKIVKPDNDTNLHDHPWNARTFILKGWYRERRLDGYKMRYTGDTARLNFDEYHSIVMVDDVGVYTLFVSGRRRGMWGFLVGGVKVPYKEHLGILPKTCDACQHFSGDGMNDCCKHPALVDDGFNMNAWPERCRLNGCPLEN